jgi:hypothetical protein
MSNSGPRLVAPIALVIGAVLGMAGTFVPTAPLRGLLWGLDGTVLVIAAALLAVHHVRRGNDLVAAGFLVFVAGQTLVVATAAMDLVAGAHMFAAGVSLWAASLALISAPRVMPSWVRAAAVIAAALFAIVAAQIFAGHVLSPLSEPLPFFAYPFLAASLFGWAWTHYRHLA